MLVVSVAQEDFGSFLFVSRNPAQLQRCSSRVAAFIKLLLMQSIAFSSSFSFTIFLLRSEISSASYLRRGRLLVLEAAKCPSCSFSIACVGPTSYCHFACPRAAICMCCVHPLLPGVAKHFQSYWTNLRSDHILHSTRIHS